jgi:signal transduction histidine kinase
MFLKRLYVRIWLAVVLAVAVLTLLVGWAWRMASDPPLRDVVVRNQAGQIIGSGYPRQPRSADLGAGRPGRMMGGAGRPAERLDEANRPDGPQAPPGSFGSGPEFMVQMQDGQTLHLHLPRPPRSPWTRPFGFFWMLALVGIAVALATYPIIRKLTRRLERLQSGVEQWGRGDLSARVPVSGQDEVAFLAQRFNQAAERVETLVKSHESLLASQKALLANASHELRSPLTRIRMGLELMGDRAPTLGTSVSSLPPEGAFAPGGGPAATHIAPTLGTGVSSLPPEGAFAPGGGPAALKPSINWKNEISRNISELDLLIDEILLASRLDAREADLGTIEAVDLIGLLAEECARVNATLDVQTGGAALQVQGVTKLLRRAVRNLLENAQRHAAGEVGVRLQHTGDLALIRVCDRGPGVPAHLRERIFEPFYRLPGASENDGGVGLGLALVKSISSRHGGSVRCEDHAGGGACFVIELPAAQA